MTSAAELEIREALRASGEVGQDLLNVDWAATPLGEPQNWQRSLVTIVRAVLTSRFSMWMAWGPKLTFFCNEAYRRDTLGRKYPWALGRPAREVWEEIWPEIGPRIEGVLSTGQATWDEALLLFLERSGYTEETYHTFSYSPLSDDEGRIAGMLCVVTEETDRLIGERRMALLRELAEVPVTVGDEREFLREASIRLGRVQSSLPFTITYLFDEAGGANRVAQTSFSGPHPLAPEYLATGTGQSPWPLEKVRDGSSALIEDLPERYTGIPTGAWDRPPQNALVVPLLRQGQGTPYGFLVVGVNPFHQIDPPYRGFVQLIALRLAAGVASARSVEAERRRAESLAELDRARTAFFSNVSHELRTPLTLMLAPMEDALRTEDALERDELRLVHRNALRLLKLVNTLLDFSRAEAGRMRATFRPVELAALTEELAATFSDAARRGRLTLTIDAERTSGPVFVDPDMWERIVLNLLSNAFKATLEGEITVRLRSEDGHAVLTVSDTGPGIPADEIDRLFERFYRVNNPALRSHEGAGIGLALVKELVALHGGEVTVASEFGHGATFMVRVPLGSDHLPAEQVVHEGGDRAPAYASLFVQEVLSWGLGWDDEGPVPPAPLAPGGSRPRVLVADDNADLRSYLTRVLGSQFDVEAVGDGEAALARVREDPPDLLISDVMMPRMDGFQLLEALRRDPDTRELPVVMLSARAGEEASIEGLQAGADDYLPKPFSGRELLARVMARVELAALRQESSAELRAERHRLEATLQQMPVGVVLAEVPSGRVTFMNRQVAAILGYEPAGANSVAEYTGGGMRTLDGEPLPPERTALARAVRDGIVTEEEDFLYITHTGRRIILRSSAAPVRDEQGDAYAAVTVLQDVTERVRTQGLLAGQRDILQAIAASEPLEPILARIAQEVERLADFEPSVAIQLVGDDGRSLVHGAAPSLPADISAAIDGLEIGPGAGSIGAAAATQAIAISPEIATDPEWGELSGVFDAHGLRSGFSIPVIAADGELVAVISLFHAHLHTPTSGDRRMAEVMARPTAVAIERARDARTQARQLDELQSSLLPRGLPAVPGLDVAVRFHPGDLGLNVGGDFYDVFALPSGNWGFVVGDVCGHGAEAAAVTALARHTVRAVARLGHSPAELLAILNDALLASEYGRFCTVVVGCLERSAEGARTRVRMANGGHLPPLLRRGDSSVETLTEHGPLVGVFAEAEYSEFTAELAPGDVLVLYTDGLVERNSRLIGEEELPQILSDLRGADASSLAEGLEYGTLGPPPRRLRDDVAVLVLRAE